MTKIQITKKTRAMKSSQRGHRSLRGVVPRSGGGPFYTKASIFACDTPDKSPDRTRDKTKGRQRVSILDFGLRISLLSHY